MLRLVDEGRLIPVVGEDLLTHGVGATTTSVYKALAERLVEVYALAPAGEPGGLPAGSSKDEELHSVVKRLYARGLEAHAIYRELRKTLEAMEPLVVPPSLSKLAQIQAFKFYVTTTFEGLLARAVDEDRFGGQRQTLVFSFAPSDKNDLPQEFDRLDRPLVFHLLGRMASTPGSYAITAQDQREFLQSLQSKTEDAPHLLLDKLRRSDLLILGSRAADWLTGFFIRHTAGGRVVESGLSAKQAPSVVLLQHFSGGARITRADDAEGFVDELHRRWSTWSSQERPKAPPRSRRSQTSGAIFLSYAGADLACAQRLRDRLDLAGVDVIMDCDDASVDTVDERDLRRQLIESSAFVPLISTRALSSQRRFFLPEWIETLEEARTIAPSSRFVFPVVIDGENWPGSEALPPPLEAEDAVFLPDGRADETFIGTVIELQRRFRSTSFA